MLTRSGRFLVEGRPTRWVRSGALDGRPLILLAHGAGAPLDHPFLQQLTRALDQYGLAVARFHFPYMERRKLLGRMQPPDRAQLLIATWRRVLALAERWEGAGPLFAMGKSMGARMATCMLAEGGADSIRAMVSLGYPLHPAGKPERLRDAHLHRVPVPQLFVQGERDKLCERPIWQKVLRDLVRNARSEVSEVVVPGADHSLQRRRGETITTETPWLPPVVEFIRGWS